MEGEVAHGHFTPINPASSVDAPQRVSPAPSTESLKLPPTPRLRPTHPDGPHPDTSGPVSLNTDLSSLISLLPTIIVRSSYFDVQVAGPAPLPYFNSSLRAPAGQRRPRKTRNYKHWKNKMFCPMMQRPMPYMNAVFTPTKPSPLSSSPMRSSPDRESGIDDEMTFNFEFQMSSPPQPLKPKIANGNMKKRIVKKNPLIHGEGKDGARAARRKLFLDGVKRASREKTFEKKGGDEEILRALFMAERNMYRARGLREGDQYWHHTPEAEEYGARPAIRSLTQPVVTADEQQMADEIERLEQLEVEAYAEEADDYPVDPSSPKNDTETVNGQNDDEDLFEDLDDEDLDDLITEDMMADDDDMDMD